MKWETNRRTHSVLFQSRKESRGNSRREQDKIGIRPLLVGTRLLAQAHRDIHTQQTGANYKN
jgi:hypothetical protein